MRESVESQRSGFSGLCSLHGWLEVRSRVSQLTGPCSDWNMGPAHARLGFNISLTVEKQHTLPHLLTMAQNNKRRMRENKVKTREKISIYKLRTNTHKKLLVTFKSKGARGTCSKKRSIKLVVSMSKQITELRFQLWVYKVQSMLHRKSM